MRKRAEKKASRIAEPEPIGKPSLNSKSMRMVKDKGPDHKNYADYLISKGKEYEQHKKELADGQLKNDDEDLTFSPKIIVKPTKQDEIKMNKFEMLYQ